MEALSTLQREFREALAAAGSDPAAVEAVRLRFLGRKGELTALVRGLGALPASERPAAGAAINALKEEIAQALEIGENTVRSRLSRARAILREEMERVGAGR